jgi:hypothetical protein
MIYKYQLIAKLPMVILAIDCFQHSKWMPINANQCVTTRGYSGPLFSISLYHYQAQKATELLGDIVCSANWLVYWLGTCVNFIPNSEGSLALILFIVCPMLFCN